MRLVVYSRFGLRFASHGPRIRSARAPALLAFSSAVGWVSGVRFDGGPPRVSVCISEAVRPRDEVLPQGNADVPSRTTAGGFKLSLICIRIFQGRSSSLRIALLSSCFLGPCLRLLRRAIQVQFALEIRSRA